MILNQINSGKACPRSVQDLRGAIPEGSLMTFISVHAFTLAEVLDRLEALEVFEREVLKAYKLLRGGAGKRLAQQVCGHEKTHTDYVGRMKCSTCKKVLD